MQGHDNWDPVTPQYRQEGGAKVVVDVVKVGHIGVGLAEQSVQIAGGLSIPEKRKSIPNRSWRKAWDAVIPGFDEERTPTRGASLGIGHGKRNHSPPSCG
jgi:hypothetical protein